MRGAEFTTLNWPPLIALNISCIFFRTRSVVTKISIRSTSALDKYHSQKKPNTSSPHLIVFSICWVLALSSSTSLRIFLISTYICIFSLSHHHHISNFMAIISIIASFWMHFFLEYCRSNPASYNCHKKYHCQHLSYFCNLRRTASPSPSLPMLLRPWKKFFKRKYLECPIFAQ